jgi:hypothetical protein
MAGGWFVEDGSVVVPERAAARLRTGGLGRVGLPGVDRVGLPAEPGVVVRRRSFGNKATFRHRSVKTVTTSSHTTGEPAHMSSSTTRWVGAGPCPGRGGRRPLPWVDRHEPRPEPGCLGRGDAGHVELDERSLDAPALTNLGSFGEAGGVGGHHVGGGDRPQLVADY